MCPFFIYTSIIIWPILFRDDAIKLKVPRNIEEAKDLGRVLSKYKDSHYYTVLGGVIVTYILYPVFKMDR